MDIIYSALRLLTEPWALLALVASFAFACENHIDEWLLNRLGGNTEEAEESDAVGTLVIISGLFGLVVAIVFGLVAYFAPDKSVTILVGKGLATQATIIGMFEVTWLIPYLYAVNRAGALAAAPLFQSIPVIALILGIGFFAEVPPMVHIIGAGVIISGGVLLNLTEVEGKWQIDKKTVGLMLLASTIITLISFLFKDNALEGNFVATAFWGGIGMFVSSVLIFTLYRPYRLQFLKFARKVDKQSIRIQLINETVDMVASLTQRLAIILGPSVMTVEALNAYQPVFILLIDWFLTKNGSKSLHTGFAKKATAIVFIALGTILIAQ